MGSSEFVTRWVTNKVQSWVKEISLLSTIALSQPQSAFFALTHGHWTYIFRTCPNIDSPLQPLENILRTTFLPVTAITSQDAPDDCLRDLLGLPCHAGGLGIPNPCVMSRLVLIIRE